MTRQDARLLRWILAALFCWSGFAVYGLITFIKNIWRHFV